MNRLHYYGLEEGRKLYEELRSLPDMGSFVHTSICEKIALEMGYIIAGMPVIDSNIQCALYQIMFDWCEGVYAPAPDSKKSKMDLYTKLIECAEYMHNIRMQQKTRELALAVKE